MKKIITKTFGLRDDEIRISFLMLSYIFIIITVLLIVKPTVNALFISELRADNLPFGYLLVAGVAVLSSFFYNKAIRKLSLVKVTIISLTTFSLAFVILGFLIKYTIVTPWILYFYYVFISLFAVVATSQFWLFANMVFNAREAKRNFGFIGAGAIAGGIFGGYLTSIIASNFGNEFAVFLAALLILFCIPILKKVYHLKIQFLNVFKRKQIIANQENLESSSLRLIANSKHLTYISLITGIGVIVAKLVDFQFSDFADKAIPDSDELAAFFGFWFSTFNVFALVIQLFFTNKILSRLGVSSTLLILPLVIAFGSLLFLTFPELWVLILIKGIDGSAKQSINKAAVELSIMPIPLLEKNQAKSYIDVVVDSLATGFAGFLLIFLIKRLDLNSSYITVIILLFTFIWILLIYRLREAYFNSFKINIQKTLTFDKKNAKNKSTENTVADVKNVLENGDETSILNILNRLKDYKQTTFNTKISKLLKHPSNQVKTEAIKFLSAFEQLDILDLITPLVNSDDSKLVFVALDYILEHSPNSTELHFKMYLEHQNKQIAHFALLALAKQSSSNSKLKEKYHLLDRLEISVAALNSENSKIDEEFLGVLLMSIAYAKLTNYYKFISKYLKSDDKNNVKYATKAAGISSDELFIEDLLVLLEVKQHRKRAVKALKNYGPRIIDILLQIDKNNQLNPSIRKYLPKVIESFNNEKAVRILTKLLSSKNAVTRLEASKSLKKLNINNQKIHISIRIIKNYVLSESKFYKSTLEIISSMQSDIHKENENEEIITNTLVYEAKKNILVALEKVLENNLKCIFNLLSLIYNEEDIHMTYVGIQSEIKEAKINSLEFLDNILENKLKMMVLPVIENYVIDENKLQTSVIKLTVLSEKKYLNKIIKMGGTQLKILVFKYLQASKNKNCIEVLLPLTKFKNKEVVEMAKETYRLLKEIKR